MVTLLQDLSVIVSEFPFVTLIYLDGHHGTQTRKRDVSANSDPHFHVSILFRTLSFAEHQINFVQSVC